MIKCRLKIEQWKGNGGNKVLIVSHPVYWWGRLMKHCESINKVYSVTNKVIEVKK